MRFIRKVYGILTAQFVLTSLMVFLACVPNIWPEKQIAVANAYHHFLHSGGLLALFIVLMLVSIISLVCCGLDRVVPINYVLLFAFTVSEGWLISIICARTNPRIVLEATCLTTAMVIAITVYAATTKSDFTMCGPILFICLAVFSLTGLFAWAFGFHLGLLWSLLGVILFSFYLLYDTQLILGGKRCELSEDSYILAAVNLYLDIVMIFVYLLGLLGGSN